ncbi:rhomboid family intramembrane serine protease [Nemorincola caseinilytica]|uniref:Rhomboid family intramembrane serine protease n=1 Tax=Nemorincola caseinilytica TaxID=2054315 RepID=A0ABP8N4G1_9BACT
MYLTILTIIVTVIISIMAFSNNELMDKFILWPRRMDSPQEYYRLLSSGFIHADWNHLLFNMFSLYFVGTYVEMVLGFGFFTLYLTGIIVASLPSFIKNKNNSYYRSLGASGGVSAAMFFFIYFQPWSSVNIMFIPIGIYAIVFGVIYLACEVYMSKRGMGNVNHDAHIWGAAYGLLYGVLIDPTHGAGFIQQMLHPPF